MENTAFMVLQKGRIAYWFPFTLAASGCVALLVGIFVAVLSIPKVVASDHFGANLNTKATLYVSESACLSCHEDRPWDWSTTLYTQVVVEPAQQPQAVTTLDDSQHVQQISLGEIVEAYTSSSSAGSVAGGFHQNYVIQTESGDVLLPNQVGSEQGTESSLTECGTCHTRNVEPLPFSFEMISLVGIRPISLNVLVF